MRIWLALLLAALAIAPARADEPPLTAEQYARVIDGLVARVQARVRVLAQRTFASRLELAAALAELTPLRMQTARDEVLAELHLSGAQVAAFVQAHPDVAKNDHIGERMQQAIAPLEGKAQSLPRLDDLEGALVRAQKQHKPVVVFFSAEWCMPCKEMLDKSLMDARVLEVLRRYELAVIDVTGDDDRAHALQKRYRAETLPTLLVLRDGRERLRLDRFAAADQLRAALDGALKN